MKLLDFKTVSPLFEMERDGIKPFTTRKIERDDKRQRALGMWQPSYAWGARITNPATGENFIREIVAVSFVRYFDSRQNGWERHARFTDWRIIVLGDIVEIKYYTFAYQMYIRRVKCLQVGELNAQIVVKE